MKTVQLKDAQIEALLKLGIIDLDQVIDNTIHVKGEDLQPWEKYPTLESCWDGGEDCWNVDYYGNIEEDPIGYYNYSTEAEAKRVRATIKLSRIARKWNEGVEIESTVWFANDNGSELEAWEWIAPCNAIKVLPFYFHTKELLERSLEMFEQDWKDFYGK